MVVKSLPYWVFFAVPIATLLGLAGGGLWILAGLGIVFVAVPLLEVLARTADRQRGAPTGPRRRWAYDLPLFATSPCSSR